MAATMAPVSSKALSLSVMAARITASCHSKGMPSERTHSCQYCVVSSQEAAADLAGAFVRGLVGAQQQGDAVLEEKWRFPAGWR